MHVLSEVCRSQTCGRSRGSGERGSLFPSKGGEEGKGLLISAPTSHRTVTLTQFGPSPQSSPHTRGEQDQRLDAKHLQKTCRWRFARPRTKWISDEP
jgi:hypothetical protein